MAQAEIEYTQAPDPDRGGRQFDCVIARCCACDDESEPVWGQSVRSVRRALAMLSQECSCGESYHKASDGEDED